MELSYLNIAIKLIMGLLSSVLVINISGKGNLAPSSTMDQVSNYVLGGIVGRVIYAPNITVLQFFIVLMIWTIIVLLLKWLKTNSVIFKSILDGQPVILIKKGVLDVEACRRADPKYPIITDGTVQTNILEVIDKDTEWLETRLKEMGYDNISDIFLAEYDNGKITVVTY